MQGVCRIELCTGRKNSAQPGPARRQLASGQPEPARKFGQFFWPDPTHPETARISLTRDGSIIIKMTLTNTLKPVMLKITPLKIPSLSRNSISPSKAFLFTLSSPLK